MTRLAWIAAASLTTVVGLVGYPIAASAERELMWQIAEGNWTGGAYRDESGPFSHCSVAATYVSGITLAFAITSDYRLEIGLFNDAWDLPVGEGYSVQLVVDRRQLGSFPASPTNPNALIVNAGDRVDVLQRLQRGYQLEVHAQRETFYFELSGTYRALDEVVECVRLAKLLAPGTPNPFARGGSSNPFSQDSPGSSEDSRAAIRALLDASGLSDIRFVDPAALDLDPKAWAWAWVSGPIQGGLAVLPLQGTTLEQAASGAIAGIGQECLGNFASGSAPSRTAGRGKLKRFSAACETKDGAIYVAATALDWDDTLLLFLNIAGGDSAGIVAANARIEELLVSLLTD